MNAVEKRNAQRFLYLRRLYEKANGSVYPYLLFTEIGRELGWDDSISDEVSEYLKKAGLIEFGSTSTVNLTGAGKDVVAEALSYPDQPTQFFSGAYTFVIVNGNIYINGDLVGRDQITTNVAGGDVVGRDKSTSSDTYGPDKPQDET